MRQGLGLLCVALLALVVSLVAGMNAEPMSTAEQLARVIRVGALFLGIGGLVMLAYSLFKSPN